MPNFNIKIEVVKKPEKEENKKDSKKVEPEKKKEGKDKKQPDAKKEKSGKASKTEPAPVPVVEKKWSPPELKFEFYDFKTELVNSKDLKGYLTKFFSERW